MKLSDLKSDKHLLISVLPTLKKKRGRDQHYLCPFHEERTGSFSIFQGRSDIWRYYCFGCGAKGTVIDAAMRVWGLKTCRQAVDRISSELGVRVMRDVEYQEPIPDIQRAERFIGDCHDNLMGNYAVQEKFLVGKRGITSLELVKKYRIGWAEGVQFAGWRSWRVTGWTIPVLDEKGNLLGVKIHSEGRRKHDQPKSLWAPFGTYPSSKPRHGTNTWFPRVEEHYAPAELYLAPGELKAFALINAGYAAISPTTGESRLPVRMIERIRDVSPGIVLICYDDDPAGIRWKDSAEKDLRKAGVPVGSFCLSSPLRHRQAQPSGGGAGDSDSDLGKSPSLVSPRRGEPCGASSVSPVDPPEISVVDADQLWQSTVFSQEHSHERGEDSQPPPSSPPPSGFTHPDPCSKCGGCQFWRTLRDDDWTCVRCLPPKLEQPREVCTVHNGLVVFGEVPIG